ncbi:NrfD/PsrC family molybdoenzyme membrane anchor subunit [Ferroglobus sp.]|uniref:NrfD/PsrC family molybdoenzyme membrane anchor subunit n=1 Tax=Ferroglobus sp. TaxID=2614230 RepID=UPI0025B9B2EB|nr:NrfD/PsrC family molybdoenzyme membrane anchor subunit [Ferroglobus sp.]
MLNYTFFYGLGDLELNKYWGVAIATYLFLGGLAGGMYIAGYFAHLYRNRDEVLSEISKFGIYLSGIILILGLLSLIYDHPNVLIAVINPTLFRNLGSWLAVGSWIILFFLVIWFGLLLEYFKKLKLPERLKLAVMSVNAFLAFMVILYTALLLRGAEFVPMWKSNALPALFVVSGISTGIAICTIYGALRVKKAEKKFKLADSALILIEIVLILYFISELSSMSNLTNYPPFSVAAAKTLDLILQGEYSGLFIYGFVGFGLIFPLLLYALSILKKSLVADLISSLSVIAGGYIFRLIVVAAAAKALVFP